MPRGRRRRAHGRRSGTATSTVMLNAVADGDARLQRARDRPGRQPTPRPRPGRSWSTRPRRTRRSPSGPTGPTNDTDADLHVHLHEAGSTFECRVDGAAFAACTSPFTHAPRSATARTPSRSAPSTPPATRDAHAGEPQTSSSTPARRTRRSRRAADARATTPRRRSRFTSSEAGATFQCRIDARRVRDLLRRRSPRRRWPTARHTFEVRADRRRRQPDPTPAHADVRDRHHRAEHDAARVRRRPTTRRRRFSFTSNEAGATFECRVDGAAFAACTDAVHHRGRSRRAAHVRGPRPRRRRQHSTRRPRPRTFTVDTTAPDTTLTPVTTPSNDNTPTFSFTSSEAATFQCRVDAAAFAACASPLTTAPRRRRAHLLGPRDRRRRERRRDARDADLRDRHGRAGHDDRLGA